MKKIVINHAPWQTRVAILTDGKLENVYFESHVKQTLERAFFRGIITKVLPGIQTAFVDIGQERAGFLHISEIDHDLTIKKFEETLQLDDESAKKPGRPKKLDIQEIFREGDPVLVQVSKEPMGQKGAKLKTCFTLPGRFIVLMPNIPRIGISKKIEDVQERKRLREIVKVNLPEGMGAIIRTPSQEQGEKKLKQDINFLVNTWQGIQKGFKSGNEVEKLHEDFELSFQVVRDHLDDDVEGIVTDNKHNQKELYRFIKKFAPEYSHCVALYDGQKNIFDHYGVQRQIDQALEKKAQLKSGGYLVIESTEAMTVIDVNTGKFIGKANLEDTIFKTNTEAAQEIVRQLKVRNIGGLIVIDFIDMRKDTNRQKLFRLFEKTLKEQDKFQSVVLKVSEFGLVQMTRKRSGKTLQQELTKDCATCHGLGYVKSIETDAHAILRKLQEDLKQAKGSASVTLHVNPTMFEHISSIEYDALLSLEKDSGANITLATENKLAIDQYKIEKK